MVTKNKCNYTLLKKNMLEINNTIGSLLDNAVKNQLDSMNVLSNQEIEIRLGLENLRQACYPSCYARTVNRSGKTVIVEKQAASVLPEKDKRDAYEVLSPGEVEIADNDVRLFGAIIGTCNELRSVFRFEYVADFLYKISSAVNSNLALFAVAPAEPASLDFIEESAALDHKIKIVPYHVERRNHGSIFDDVRIMTVRRFCEILNVIATVHGPIDPQIGPNPYTINEFFYDLA